MLRKLMFLSVSAAFFLASCSSSEMSSDSSVNSSPSTTKEDASSTSDDPMNDDDGHDDHDHDHDHGSARSGLASSGEGLGLVFEDTKWEASPVELRFSIVDVADGGVFGELNDYLEVHAKTMHVAVVKHDLSEYYHVHPVLSDGVWVSEPLALSEGFYRVVADFKVKDRTQVALGVDVTVGKSPKMVMADLSQEVRVSSVDGYSVSVVGSTQHESDQVLSFTISKDGVPVSSVEPYLGSNGHLVSYDSSSLLYTHMHPNSGIMNGTITFKAPPTEHGFSRYFLEVKLDGKVRLFTFVLENM